MSLIPMCHAGPETGHRHVPLSSHAPCVRVSVRCDEFLYGTKKRPASRAARAASRGAGRKSAAGAGLPQAPGPRRFQAPRRRDGRTDKPRAA